jgi:5-methylthioadenosine/S-adenosylhomocysteine deaminase
MRTGIRRTEDTPRARRHGTRVQGRYTSGQRFIQMGGSPQVDRGAARQLLHQELTAALTDEEVGRRGLAKALVPHVKAFYDGYIPPAGRAPYYRPSSHV